MAAELAVRRPWASSNVILQHVLEFSLSKDTTFVPAPATFGRFVAKVESRLIERRG